MESFSLSEYFASNRCNISLLIFHSGDDGKGLLAGGAILSPPSSRRKHRQQIQSKCQLLDYISTRWILLCFLCRCNFTLKTSPSGIVKCQHQLVYLLVPTLVVDISWLEQKEAFSLIWMHIHIKFSVSTILSWLLALQVANLRKIH